ncbi:Ca2+-binding protein, EF-hand superfamily [Amycolatopsis xylanica]|uniref:Ca2+-binding protein, EF-hand superfamily n=1 Tax=Amycolatopsis xylanica TaxID=589385 RepID=A0A1H2V4Q5_9PSEU|nr:EF-hand domain-containing protein [Amycolatopsis xylanica]SDW63277.1 Ca2+-binding protein, EF-hand superfamily [Amycolatopsis xylanica]
MASEFQRRKIATVFTAMDDDGDAYLDETDFEALTGRWVALRGVTAGSAEGVRLRAIMMGWWSTLLAASERADKVSLDDVLMVVDQLGGMLDAVTATAETMFDAIDENGDGEISRAEYRQLIEAWNGTATDTDETFGLLDLDGDGHLSRKEFVEHWTEFWAGDNPDAPGTWVFGRF